MCDRADHFGFAIKHDDRISVYMYFTTQNKMKLLEYQDKIVIICGRNKT